MEKPLGSRCSRGRGLRFESKQDDATAVHSDGLHIFQRKQEDPGGDGTEDGCRCGRDKDQPWPWAFDRQDPVAARLRPLSRTGPLITTHHDNWHGTGWLAALYVCLSWPFTYQGSIYGWVCASDGANPTSSVAGTTHITDRSAEQCRDRAVSQGKDTLSDLVGPQLVARRIQTFTACP